MNWKNNGNLKSGCQATRHLMREFVKTHVFEANKFVDHGKNDASKLLKMQLENNMKHICESRFNLSSRNEPSVTNFKFELQPMWRKPKALDIIL